MNEAAGLLTIWLATTLRWRHRYAHGTASRSVLHDQARAHIRAIRVLRWASSLDLVANSEAREGQGLITVRGEPHLLVSEYTWRAFHDAATRPL